MKRLIIALAIVVMVAVSGPAWSSEPHRSTYVNFFHSLEFVAWAGK
jgi:hypothetical protein